MITKKQYEAYKVEAELLRISNKNLRDLKTTYISNLASVETSLNNNYLRLNTIEMMIKNYEKQEGDDA